MKRVVELEWRHVVKIEFEYCGSSSYGVFPQFESIRQTGDILFGSNLSSASTLLRQESFKGLRYGRQARLFSALAQTGVFDTTWQCHNILTRERTYAQSAAYLTGAYPVSNEMPFRPDQVSFN